MEWAQAKLLSSAKVHHVNVLEQDVVPPPGQLNIRHEALLAVDWPTNARARSLQWGPPGCTVLRTAAKSRPKLLRYERTSLYSDGLTSIIPYRYPISTCIEEVRACLHLPAIHQSRRCREAGHHLP